MFFCCDFSFTLKLIPSPVYAHASLKENISRDSGVRTFVCASTAAPWLTRTSATLTLSSWAARWRGVSPLCKSKTTASNLQRRHVTTKMKIQVSVRL